MIVKNVCLYHENKKVTNKLLTQSLYRLSQGWKFALWFFEQMARFLRAKERITSELVMSLFFKERREQLAQGCSFVKSNESDLLSDDSNSLTVALL